MIYNTGSADATHVGDEVTVESRTVDASYDESYDESSYDEEVTTDFPVEDDPGE